MESEKRVVITGSSGQLGNALVEEFRGNMWKVFALDVHENDSKMLTNNVQFYEVDIRNSLEVLKIFEQITQDHGQIDVLVNNAGIAYFSHFLHRSDSEVEEMFRVNLQGSLNCILSLVKTRFDDNQPCAIINVASLYGVVSPDFRIYGENDRRSPEMYGATKAGLIQLTKYFSIALASRNIRVNSISPGGIFNDSNPQDKEFVKRYSLNTPLNRMARVEEIVKPIMFLASEDASYISGHNLVVDGGYSAM
jgi:NAD(P)-dependent dehydrogenase (short-subunit alcohol dehydrogenase family)